MSLKQDLAAHIEHLERRRDALAAELAAVDDVLRDRRAQYARLQNEACPVYSLPNELLTSIFLACQHAARSSSRARLPQPFQVVASHVSHRWRQIVLATPLLWHQINLQILPTTHVQGRVLAQLQAHLVRSSTCFLDISLAIEVADSLAAYFALLLEHAPRWRRLSISTRFESVADVHSLLGTAQTPLLEHLSLHLGLPQEGLSPRRAYDTVQSTVLLDGSPALRFVRLAGFALGALHPPMKAITTLHLEGWTRHFMTHEQLRTILEGTPALVNLSIDQLVVHHPRDPLDLALPTDLPCLQSLRIRGPGSPLHRFIQLMKMPSLEELSLHGVDIFDAMAHPKVSSLTLEACDFGETDISNLMVSLPNITHLVIDSSMPDIFYMLKLNVADAEVAEPWPKLETLGLRELEPVDVAQFCSIIMHRGGKEGRLRSVHLDRRSRGVLRTKHRLEWLQEQIEVVAEHLPDTWPRGLGYSDVHDQLA